jgi:formylglycine-generating enzyme required for sulfatase activity
VGRRFEVKSAIGEGPLGTVYRAFDQDIEVEVALKELRGDLFSGDEERAAFLSACEGVRRLSHPNLVRIFHVDVDGDRVFYAMQLLEGLTLRRILDLRREKAQPFGLEEVAPIVSQVGAALEVAPPGGVKPENVLLLPDLLKVTDFHLCAALPRGRFLEAQRAARADAYFAPEIAGGGAPTAASAAFSLGVIAAELLTGVRPSTPEARLREVRPELPEKIEAAVQRCLASDPGPRAGAAEELVRAIGEAAAELRARAPGRSRGVGAAPSGTTPKPGVAPTGTTPKPGVAPTGTTPKPGVAPTGTTPKPGVAPTGTTPKPGVAPTGTTPKPAAAPTGATPKPAPPPRAAPFEPELAPFAAEMTPRPKPPAPSGAGGAIARPTPPPLPAAARAPERPTEPPQGEPTTVMPAGILPASLLPAPRRPVPLYVWVVLILALIGGGTYGAIWFIDEQRAEEEQALLRDHERQQRALARGPVEPKPAAQLAQVQVAAVAPAPAPKVPEPPAPEPEARKEPPGKAEEVEDEPKRKKRAKKREEPEARTESPKTPKPPEPPTPAPAPTPEKPKETLVAAAGAALPPAEVPKKCPAGMVRIKAGAFRMGSAADDPMRNFGERRLAAVKTDEYCIDRYEYPNARGAMPLSGVTWNRAQELCAAKGKRLCSEEEWERACKGYRGLRFPYGDEFDDKKCNTESAGGENRPIAGAGSFPECKSGFGVFDMSGNVAEWTATPLAAGSKARIIKGGAGNKPDWAVRCANRGNKPAGSRDSFLGFRCCGSPG